MVDIVPKKIEKELCNSYKIQILLIIRRQYAILYKEFFSLNALFKKEDRTMKRIISVLLVLAMCAVLFTGCTRDENDKGPIIRMYISSYPRSLDPSAYLVSAESTKLFGLIYEALTAVDDEGLVVPALAESWYGLYDN